MTDDVARAVGRELTGPERWSVGNQIDQDTCREHYRFCCPTCFPGATDDADVVQTVIDVSGEPVVWARAIGFRLAAGDPDLVSMSILVRAA